MARKSVQRDNMATLAEMFRELRTEPFAEKLALAFEVGPTKQELRHFAAKKPGEWATLVKTLASLAGYADKKAVSHDGVIAHIHGMSDAELLERARSLSLGRTEPQKVIDIRPELVEDFSKQDE